MPLSAQSSIERLISATVKRTFRRHLLFGQIGPARLPRLRSLLPRPLLRHLPWQCSCFLEGGALAVRVALTACLDSHGQSLLLLDDVARQVDPALVATPFVRVMQIWTLLTDPRASCVACSASRATGPP